MIPDREHACVMRDGLAAGDRVQFHINNGKKKAYIATAWLDQALSRGSVGRFLSGPGEVCFCAQRDVLKAVRDGRFRG